MIIFFRGHTLILHYNEKSRSHIFVLVPHSLRIN